MKAELRKQQQFFDLAERFRNATDPEEVKRIGEEMGEMVFGNSVIACSAPPHQLPDKKIRLGTRDRMPSL
jgi:hypothetical protein